MKHIHTSEIWPCSAFTHFPKAFLEIPLMLFDWPLGFTAARMAMSASFTHTFLNNLAPFGPEYCKCAPPCEMKMRTILSHLPRLCSFPDRIVPHHLLRALSYSLLPAGCLNTICSWKKLSLTTSHQVWKVLCFFSP